MLRLSAIFALFLPFVSACSAEKQAVGRSLEDVAGFCAEWAARACTEAVVSACSFPSASACQNTQVDVCTGLVSEDKYSPLKAQQCLEAVGNAYKDDELTPEERDVVLHLGGACSEVLSGEV